MITGRLPALILAWAISSGVQAQDQAVPLNNALERGTPYSSARGFPLAAGRQDFDTTTQYLDLRNLPRDVEATGRPELAHQLNREDAILFRMQRYVDSREFAEIAEIAEQFNLRIVDIVEGQSASFALPNRMLFGATQSKAATI